jgi:DNA-binding transcriptional ArsR family regulator
LHIIPVASVVVDFFWARCGHGMNDSDLIFRALADPSRRKLFDALNASDAQTLTELCEHLDMTRQAVTQHLNVLENAHLVAPHI